MRDRATTAVAIAAVAIAIVADDSAGRAWANPQLTILKASGHCRRPTGCVGWPTDERVTGLSNLRDNPNSG